MSLMGYFHIGQKQGNYEITRLITLYYCHKLTQGHPYRTCFSYTGLHSRSLMPMTMIKQHLTGAGICVASGNTRVIAFVGKVCYFQIDHGVHEWSVLSKCMYLVKSRCFCPLLSHKRHTLELISSRNKA